MSGIKDLIASERGVFSIVLVLASMVLVITGHLTADSWVALAQWIGTVLIASKTATNIAESITAPRVPAVPAAVSPPQI